MPVLRAESRLGRFGINALSSVATRVLSATVLVWVNQHLLRRIAPEEYSLFPLVMSLMVFSDLFVAVFVGGVSRHLVEAHHRPDPLGVPRVVSSMLVVLVPVALVVALAGALAAWRLGDVVTVAPAYLDQARLMLLLTVLTFAVTTATTPLALGLYVRERFVTENGVLLACEVLRIVLLLTLLLGVGTSVTWLVVASSTATLANQAVQIALTRRALPTARFALGLVSWGTIRQVLSFGVWTSVNGLGQLLAGTAPILLLNRFARPFDVAVFHAGRLPDMQLRALLQAIEGPAQPALVGLFAREGKRALDQLYLRGGRYYLWLALLPVAPLLVFAGPLYRLYAGAEYASAGLVMAALLASYPLLFASGMFYRVAHATGRLGAFQLYYLLVQLAAVAALAYAVVQRGAGAVGAAVALALAYGVLHVFLLWPLGLRLVGAKWSAFVKETLARGLLPFAAALLLCVVIGRLVTVASWTGLIVVGASSVVAYLAVLLGWCLDDFDRGLLQRFLQRLDPRPARPPGDERV